MALNLDKTYLGTVESNNDPKRLGRCRIRVLGVFDNIPKDDLPWASPNKDLNGNQFIIPDVGKICSIKFEDNDIYLPVYSYANHYNKNLEDKLKDLSEDDYRSMKAILFDDKTQIYSNSSEGLKIDYKMNNINITDDDIDINLKDNHGRVNIGTANAKQEAILGTNFLTGWFDELVDNLLGANGGPFLGNLGAPVIPHPALIQHLLKYKAKKDPDFLSNNVWLNDNYYIDIINRKYDKNVKGDQWKSTIEENELTIIDEPDFTPKDYSPDWTPDGQLSTPGDGSVVEGLSEEEINSQEPPVGDINPDVEVFKEVLRNKNYIIYDEPFRMNVIGVRYQYQGQEYTNQHTDRMYIMFKDDNSVWRIKYWSCSTMPGVYRNNATARSGGPLQKDEKGPDRGGMGILKPAQYVNGYSLGDYKGMKVLRSVGPQLAYRDKNYGNTQISFTEDPNNKNGGKNFYMHIHQAFSKKYPNQPNVNAWSEGCQVFGRKKEFDDFINYMKVHEKNWGNKFTYTLITSRDVSDAEERIERRRNDNV